ncbi:hypothetical protein ACS0TY_014022 [Phlomoides rotata]
MAISQTHFRSISLPSRLQSKPTDLESDLQKLKSLQVSATSEAIQSGLLRIAELYNSAEEISQCHEDEKSMEESLSGSVELLDGCNAIREVFQMMKENIQTLQSALRRKVMDSSVQTYIHKYFCCRKRINKSIVKTLKTLKKSEQMMRNNGDCAFRELTRITMAIFKSILFLLSSRASGGFSLVSKLMNRRENDGVVSEVESVELGLMSLQKTRSIEGIRVVEVQKKLQNLEAIVDGFDGGLERLFRQLLHIRVSLLNILTDH